MGSSIADTDLDDDSDFAESHEINVTPFIDVILVLLIIFMVAAPLSTVDLPIDLPTSTATPQKKPDKRTYVSIKPDLAVAIGEKLVKRFDLVHSVDAMADASKDRYIFLRADRRGAIWRADGRGDIAPAAIPRSSWWRSKVFRKRRRRQIPNLRLPSLERPKTDV
jgi:biopolymer transport protein ExbD